MTRSRVDNRASDTAALCRVCATPVVWVDQLRFWVHEASGRAMRGDADGGTHRATPG